MSNDLLVRLRSSRRLHESLRGLPSPGLEEKVTSKKTSVLAVDDHPLLLEGIESILANAQDIELVGQARDGREAVALYGELRPDVTLMDVQMPVMNGIDALIAIRALHAQAKVIVLTIQGGDGQARRAIRAGAVGYLLKSMAQKELHDAIRIVHRGGKYIPTRIALELANGSLDDGLSQADVDVLKLVSKGLSNKQVALALHLPEESVKSRMRGILARLAAKDRTHAVTIALRRGIIDID